MRLFLLILWWVWLSASLGLLLVFYLTPYAELAHGWQLPNYAVPPFARLPLPTEARYLLLRIVLAGAIGISAIALAVAVRFQPSPPGSSQLLPRSPGRAGVSLKRLLFHYPAALPRVLTLVLLLAVLAWRIAYLQQVPIDENGAGAFPSLDEIASYDYFARPGPAVAASYYQLPNNHVAHNLLAAGLAHLLPAPPAATSALIIRLPAVVAGLLGLLLSFALLRRHAGLLTVILVTGSFHLLPLAVSYAVMGRGYALTFACAVAGTWAALHILHPASPTSRSWAWASFVLAGVLGLYAVPAHLYTVAAQGLVLLAGLAGRRAGRAAQFRLMTVALGFGAALTVLLYTPVLMLSGWRALLDNIYVQPRPGAWFWPTLGPALRTTAAELFGQGSISSGCYVALLVCFPMIWRRPRHDIGPDTRRLGWFAYAQAVLPLPLMLLQRQLAPARTLLPTAFFALVAAGLLLQVLWPALRHRLPAHFWPGTWLRPRYYRAQLAVGMTVLLVLGGYRFTRVRAILNAKAQEAALVLTAYNWLRASLAAGNARSSEEVVVSLRGVAVAWHHRALVTGQVPLAQVVAEYPEHLPPQLHHQPAYYVIGHTDDTRPGSPWAAVTRRLVRRYHDSTLSIYAVPTGQQGNAHHNQQ
jgi:hypothetical protein